MFFPNVLRPTGIHHIIYKGFRDLLEKASQPPFKNLCWFVSQLTKAASLVSAEYLTLEAIQIHAC